MKVKIADIRINNRIRRDYGNIEELAQDIQANGLINPPVVTPQLSLIAGERRVMALKSLGYESIEVRIMSVRDAEHQLKLEITENENRKEFSFSERLDWARRLELIEAAKSRERQIELGKIGGNPETRALTERVPEGGETRDIVAKETGFGSGKNYDRAKYISEHATPDMIKELDAGQLSINKAYQELIAENKAKDRLLAEKDKAIEAEKATNRRMDAVIHEKDDQLYSKDGMIKNLLNKPPEVIEKEVESPYLQKRVETLNAEVMKLNKQVSDAHNELGRFQDLKHKKEEIEELYKKIEDLKAQQSKIFKEMEETQAVFTFISKTKKFIKEEMLHIPSLVFMREKPTNILLDDLKGVITLLENFIAAMKDKFNIK